MEFAPSSLVLVRDLEGYFCFSGLSRLNLARQLALSNELMAWNGWAGAQHSDGSSTDVELLRWILNAGGTRSSTAWFLIVAIRTPPVSVTLLSLRGCGHLQP